MNFEVDRTDFEHTRVTDDDPVDLSSGQVRLEIDRFAVTTNNITYAVTGDMIGYWDFFPAKSPWGRIPAMGIGTISESAHPELDEGGRFFGFYPMADSVVIDARPRASGFADAGPHRSNHPAVYTAFDDIDMDPAFDTDRIDEELLLRGMFITSFLQDDALADHGFHGAAQTLVTSASSKTSISLAACLARRPDQRSVAVTSERNRAFVESLALYDDVVTYDTIDSLDPSVASGLVDMAGNAAVREAIHRHFGDRLFFSSMIGATHREQMGGDDDLPGPRPEFFFAPGQIAKRSKEWGPAELNRRMGAALHELIEGSSSWLRVEHRSGAEGTGGAYSALLHGEADPSIGFIVSMGSS